MKANRNVVVVGASAGGVEALMSLAAGLPDAFPAPVLIVLHLSSDSPSVLPRLLDQAGSLPAAHAIDGERVRPGKIYVAPPNLHMVLRHDHVYVSGGPRENNTRPAIDPLFRSAAVAYGPGAIGVILTGNLYDGTAGLVSIKAHGGIAVVQDPDDAVFPSMPESALREVQVDYCLPLVRIPNLLADLASREVAAMVIDNPDPDAIEVKIAAGDPDSYQLLKQIARPSPYTCPECHGALWEVVDDRILRYRCRVGHAYTAESLFALQDDEIEVALWSAIRSLEERAVLARRIVDRAENLKLGKLLERFRHREDEAMRHANVLRQLLLGTIAEESED